MSANLPHISTNTGLSSSYSGSNNTAPRSLDDGNGNNAKCRDHHDNETSHNIFTNITFGTGAYGTTGSPTLDAETIQGSPEQTPSSPHSEGHTHSSSLFVSSQDSHVQAPFQQPTSNVETNLYTNLFPSFNFINFPTSGHNKNVKNVDNKHASAYTEATDGDEEASIGSSLDSSVVDKMVDTLFDDELNVRQSLQNVASNKNFYSNYYDELMKAHGKDKVNNHIDSNSHVHGSGNNTEESDFQKYINEFNKEFKIESKLKKALDRKRNTNLNMKGKNIINVILDEDHIAQNFYVPDENDEIDLSELNEDYGTNSEKASPRMNFLSKKSFASFGPHKKNNNNNNFESRRKLKNRPSKKFLRGLVHDNKNAPGLTTSAAGGILSERLNHENQRIAALGTGPFVNPFKFKMFSSSTSLIHSASIGSSYGKQVISVKNTSNHGNDLLSLVSTISTQIIDNNSISNGPAQSRKLNANGKLAPAYRLRSRMDANSLFNHSFSRDSFSRKDSPHNNANEFDLDSLGCESFATSDDSIVDVTRRVSNGVKYSGSSAIAHENISLGNYSTRNGGNPDHNDPSGNSNDKKNGTLQKKLALRHLQMIALSGTFGVGLFLSASKNFLISGPFGALLGFSISGSLVLATMLSLCEMITFIPLVGGVSGIGSRFVDDAFGFAAGLIYWINYTISLPSEITAGTIMLSYYDNIKLPGKGAAGWISFFLIWVIAVNLLDVRVYGELEFFFSLIKLLVVIVSVIINIIINTGNMPPLHNYNGFKFWDSSQSDPSKGLTYGLFRPTFDLTDTGTGSLDGIGGNTGRFLSLLISVCVSSYAYVGTEIMVIVAGEARHPRKALPSATNRIFWRILVFYILAIFCVSLNFYSGDPRLLRYRMISKSESKQDFNYTAVEDSIIDLFGGHTCTKQKNNSRLLSYSGLYNGNQSPWIIAFQNAKLCSLSAVFNGIFVVFALSAGSSQLYASSRTLYQMSVQGKAPSVFSRCSKQGVPYLAVLFSGIFGALSYLCISNDSNNVFQRLMTICSTSGEIVWACMCLSFIRYYYGLKLRTDLTSRNSPSFPYKAPFQPYLAWYGLIGGSITVLCTGITVFLKDCWSIEFFLTSYGSLILFVLSYGIYKFVKGTKTLKIDQLQLDIGRKENDKIIWEETKEYNTNLKEKLFKLLGLFFG